MEENEYMKFLHKLGEEKLNSIVNTQANYWEKIRHPFTGGIELTPYCNLRCVHCYLQGSEKEKLLSTEEIKTIIDKLYNKGVLFLYMTGGEIFTRKDFLKIYTYAKKKGFLIELLTNLTLLDQKIVDTFNEYPPARISVSMYGKDEESYERVTGQKGMYSKFVNAVKLLRKNGLRLEIKFIALKENKDDFFAVEKFAKENDADFSFTFEIFPTLCGDKKVVNHMWDIDDIIEFEKNYEQTKKIWSVNMSDKNPYFDMKEGEAPLYMCNIGKANFLIDYKGFINPCNKMRIEKYNLLECEFDDAWDEFKKFQEVKAPKSYKCAKCKNISICNPCPAQNFMNTGKYDTPSKAVCELTEKRAKEFRKPEYKEYKENILKNLKK